MFTSYYLCILKFIYPVHFFIASFTTQFSKGAGLLPENGAAAGPDTRGRARHAHRWRCCLCRLERKPVVSRFLFFPSCCTDGETVARRMGWFVQCHLTRGGWKVGGLSAAGGRLSPRGVRLQRACCRERPGSRRHERAGNEASAWLL